MSVCINKNSIEYQSLKERAGISEFILESVCRDYMDRYGRFPYLDELPNVNSERHLKDLLHVKQNGAVKISDLLEATGKETVDEAIVDINNQYRDLETRVLPIVEEGIVDITHRPTENNFEEIEQIQPNINNNYVVLNNALQKLADLYGIKFNEITDAELSTDKWRNLIPNASSVNAFVYNGQIYINVDRANLDAPIHEMFHILVGSMRFENPELYQSLINTAEKLSNYQILVQQFPGRSRNDINEEIFITELAKYFSGLPSEFMNLSNSTMYELIYNIKRTLDTILMGHHSVKTISDDRLYNMSLLDIIKEVDSSIATNNFHGFVDVKGSELHRKLNNIKSDLIKNNLLEEYCD